MAELVDVAFDGILEYFRVALGHLLDEVLGFRLRVRQT